MILVCLMDRARRRSTGLNFWPAKPRAIDAPPPLPSGSSPLFRPLPLACLLPKEDATVQGEKNDGERRRPPRSQPWTSVSLLMLCLQPHCRRARFLPWPPRFTAPSRGRVAAQAMPFLALAATVVAHRPRLQHLDCPALPPSPSTLDTGIYGRKLFARRSIHDMI